MAHSANPAAVGTAGSIVPTFVVWRILSKMEKVVAPERYQPELWLQFLRKSNRTLQRQTRVDFFKATGRGGQKRNRTSNAVRLTLEHLSVTQSASRSRAENISGALRKLRIAIALDIGTGYHHREVWNGFPNEIYPYLQNDIPINPQNPVFPIFVGCFIDVFIHCRGNWPKIADTYAISRSRIRRFPKSNSFMLETIRKLQNQFLEDKSRQTPIICREADGDGFSIE